MCDDARISVVVDSSKLLSLCRMVSEIKRDIGRKSRLFHTPPAFDVPLWGLPSEFCHSRLNLYGKTRGVARIFLLGVHYVYRGPKLMKWSMCIATLNRCARTTATFFSMQHTSRQSYAMCHVLIRCWLSYSRKTTFKMADVHRLEFRKVNFGEMTAIFTSAHQISSKSDNYLSMT